MNSDSALTDPSASVRLRYTVHASGKMISAATNAIAGAAKTHLRWSLAQRAHAGVSGAARRLSGDLVGVVTAVMRSPSSAGPVPAGRRSRLAPPLRSAYFASSSRNFWKAWLAVSADAA